MASCCDPRGAVRWAIWRSQPIALTRATVVCAPPALQAPEGWSGPSPCETASFQAVSCMGPTGIEPVTSCLQMSPRGRSWGSAGCDSPQIAEVSANRGVARSGRIRQLLVPCLFPRRRGRPFGQPRTCGGPSGLSAHFAVIGAATRPALRLEIDLDMLADEVATRVAARLADRIASQASSPWMAMTAAGSARVLLKRSVLAGLPPVVGGRAASSMLMLAMEPSRVLGSFGRMTLAAEPSHVTDAAPGLRPGQLSRADVRRCRRAARSSAAGRGGASPTRTPSRSQIGSPR